MERGNSLTISVCSGKPRGLRAGALAALACLLLAACSIEVGPPPQSDPPLVPESAKAPPPPAQPSEPQPWSRDLALDSAPIRADRAQMVAGLVAAANGARYSDQRLTFGPALPPDKQSSRTEEGRGGEE